MSRPKKVLPRRFQFERLEERTVLNGTITFTKDVYGSLFAAGDRSANYLQIHQVGSSAKGATIHVQGLATKLKNSTTGKTASSFTFSNVRSVIVDLGGGNDSLYFYNTTLTGVAYAYMGDGNDTVSMVNVRSYYKSEYENEGVYVNMGKGNDVAALINVTVPNNGLAVHAESGRNVISLNKVSAKHYIDVSLGYNGGGQFNTVTVISSSSNGGYFTDKGSMGILTGVNNRFKLQQVTTFKYRSGDLRNNKA